MSDTRCKNCDKPIRFLEGYDGDDGPRPGIWIHNGGYGAQCPMVAEPAVPAVPDKVAPQHQAQKLYPEKAYFDFNTKLGNFEVYSSGHAIAECEDSEVADFICKAWNVALETK